MNKILGGIFILISTFVFLTIYTTTIFIKTEYKKAMFTYIKKKEAQRNYYNPQKLKIVKSRVETDIRRPIDIKKINKQIGYAMFTFEGERIKISKTLDSDIVPDKLKRCLFIKIGDRFLICNFSQTDKILLNGTPVENTCEIKYGDFVEIGEITFQFNNILGVA